MAKSAPHVYLSALPFAPSCSLVSTHYSSWFPRMLHVERGRLSHWPSCEMVISNVGGLVQSVAFSPDGHHIVSGSRDRTIRVWDATTGETVAGPFTGHTDSVQSVAFSPDGHYIVSGSRDRTIRVWNATTGETVAGPFTGHTDSVQSVAFSPDGHHIVSGSFDGTIRVWNATTGDTVAGPFTGHTGSVWSVAFSLDGHHIVSGSSDRSIRMSSITKWKTENENDNDVDFTDLSVIDGEGWICGSKGELLMWIPEMHREHLHRPNTIWISGEHETRLDLSNFEHGLSWATCINH